MAARFAERVAIGWQVDESLLAERLPVMSLQPLLENVFKHTVERRRGPTRIDITVAREGSELVLRVDDDAGSLALAPSASETNGIGLANLRARLAALHGVRATLGLFARPSGGVRAELRLPCAS
jgi:LytS/YehU family sensor histidine kinase